MSKGHNKKRNVGLVFEQALRTVSGHVMDSRVDDAKKTISMLKKHFSPGTELKKELRIFNALLKTNVKDARLAERILDVAKEGVRNINFEKLDHQKGNFVNEANRFFGKDKLFRVNVPRFRDYATVQVLMNEWRKEDPDPVLVADYEHKVIDMMLSEVKHNQYDTVPVVNSLTLKLMHEKLENKYNDNLLPTQRDFLSRAIFAGAEGDEIVDEMNDVRGTAILMLEKYLTEEKSKLIHEKYKIIQKKINGFEPDFSKESFAKHMTILHLLEELKSNE